MSKELYNYGDEIDFKRMGEEPEYEAAVMNVAWAMYEAKLEQDRDRLLGEPVFTDEEMEELASEPHIYNPAKFRQDTSEN